METPPNVFSTDYSFKSSIVLDPVKFFKKPDPRVKNIYIRKKLLAKFTREINKKIREREEGDEEDHYIYTTPAPVRDDRINGFIHAFSPESTRDIVWEAKDRDVRIVRNRTSAFLSSRPWTKEFYRKEHQHLNAAGVLMDRLWADHIKNTETGTTPFDLCAIFACAHWSKRDIVLVEAIDTGPDEIKKIERGSVLEGENILKYFKFTLMQHESTTLQPIKTVAILTAYLTQPERNPTLLFWGGKKQPNFFERCFFLRDTNDEHLVEGAINDEVKTRTKNVYKTYVKETELYYDHFVKFVEETVHTPLSRAKIETIQVCVHRDPQEPRNQIVFQFLAHLQDEFEKDGEFIHVRDNNVIIDIYSELPREMSVSWRLIDQLYNLTESIRESLAVEVTTGSRVVVKFEECQNFYQKHASSWRGLFFDVTPLVYTGPTGIDEDRLDQFSHVLDGIVNSNIHQERFALAIKTLKESYVEPAPRIELNVNDHLSNMRLIGVEEADQMEQAMGAQGASASSASASSSVSSPSILPFREFKKAEETMSIFQEAASRVPLRNFRTKKGAEFNKSWQNR